MSGKGPIKACICRRAYKEADEGPNMISNDAKKGVGCPRPVKRSRWPVQTAHRSLAHGLHVQYVALKGEMLQSLARLWFSRVRAEGR